MSIKFYLSDGNWQVVYPSGSSPNSIAHYANGGPAAAMVPADDVNQYGINFYSGNIMEATIVYDGSLLTLTLLDTVTNAQVRKSWPINIPAAVGSNNAWLGFTAGAVPVVAMLVQSWNYFTGFNARLAKPVFSVAAGQYTGAQTVTITAPAGASIYYTTNGRTPTNSSTLYTVPVSISANTVLQAVAVQSNFTDRLVTTADYQIQANGLPHINFPSGFASATNLMSLVGTAIYSGSAISLTSTTQQSVGGSRGSGAAWYVTPVNVSSFTSIFTFSPTSNASGGAGITFCIQNPPPATDYTNNNSPPYQGATPDGILRWSAGGPLTYAGPDQGLGYSGTPSVGNGQITAGFTRSVAVVFQNSSANGTNTGMYTNGADVTQNLLDMTGSGVNLTNSSRTYTVTLTYDGTTLAMTIKDNTSLATYSHSWAINIPTTVGGSTAYVGFTGGIYNQSNKNITAWTYAC
jgi:hypothetical protein